MSAPSLRSVPGSGRAFVAAAVLIVAMASLAGAAPSALAAPGAPDASFGHEGLVEERFAPTFQGSSFDLAETTANDGVKVFQTGPGSAAGFREYGPEGTPRSSDAAATKVILHTYDAEGRLVEIEQSESRKTETIRRLLPDGQPDPAFGVGGKEELPYFTGDFPHPAYPSQLVALPSGGGLIVAGTALIKDEFMGKSEVEENELAVLRLDDGGAPDPNFGSKGVVRTRTDLGLKEGPYEGRGIALRPGGGLIVAVGAYEKGNGSELIGLTAAGALDRSFGVGGIVKVKSEIEDIHGAEAGKVLVAGTEGVPNAFSRVGGDLVVSRFEDDGRIDRAYGTGGSTLVDFGGGDRLGAVLWGPDGSALLGGVSYTADLSCSVLGLCTETPALARLSPTGSLDAGFGEGGRVRLSGLTEPGGAGKTGGIHSFAARPDGGAYAAGASGTTAFLAGLEPSGGPAPGFGDGGIATATYPGESSSSIRGVAVDDRGRILVLGNTDSGSERSSGFVRRLLPDGAPDPEYGGGAEFIRVPSARQILVDGRGRALLLMGYNVLRLNSDGTLDGSFGDRGVVTPHPRPSRSDLSVGLRAMTVLPSGGFLVAATLGHPTHRPAVFRFGANGSPDRSFGRQGKSELRLGAATFYFNATTMLVEPDGRILVGGYLNHHRGANETRQMMVVRLLPDGRLDRRFGTDGAIRPRTGPAASVSALALEHGKLLVAGTERGFHRGAVVVLRHGAGGRLDRSFGKDGEVRRSEPDLSRRRDSPISLLAAPGRLIVTANSPSHPVFAYRPDGSPILGYGRDASVVSTTTGFRPPGPLAVLQGKNPILAWTASGGPGVRVGRLQRLGAR